MAEDTAAEIQESISTADKRERSRIVFPYGDLNEAITVAAAIHRNVGAAQCDVDQVAGWMHQSVTSGAFRTKVNSARIFGLVKTGQGKLSLTPLGQRVVDPETEAVARVEAFLAVPLYDRLFGLYKGITLPSTNVGLERQMAELGVSAKQTDKARQAFQRSAEQSGFFREGNNKLVRPGFAPVEMDVPADGGGGDGRGGGGTEHPLVKLLVDSLPDPGSKWSKPERQKWIKMAEAAFDVVYQDDAASASSSEPQQPSGQSPADVQE
jgi:hypothetical protein